MANINITTQMLVLSKQREPGVDPIQVKAHVSSDVADFSGNEHKQQHILYYDWVSTYKCRHCKPVLLCISDDIHLSEDRCHSDPRLCARSKSRYCRHSHIREWRCN